MNNTMEAENTSNNSFTAVPEDALEVEGLGPTPDAHEVVTDQEVEEEEEELSVLDYARLNGLASDHLEHSPLSSLLILSLGIESKLTDDSHLHHFVFPDRSIEERLSIAKDAAQLLAWVNTPDTPESIDVIMLPMLDSKDFKNIHLEFPLLKSDHALDCRSFANRNNFEIKIADVKLPLEMVDGEKNEGLSLPPSLYRRGDEILDELKKERLAVSRETMEYLSASIKVEWTDADESSLWESLRNYKKTHALEPVTPPLSPISPLPKPFEPSLSDPVFEVPVLSDPASLTKDDLQKIEKHLFDRDSQENLDIHNELLETLEKSMSPPLVSPKRVRRDFLKVEETLTPPDAVAAPKSVHFSDFVEEMRLDTPGFPSEVGSESRFFEEAFGDAARVAMCRAEQETLIVADTTARVGVPTLDFTVPPPPWTTMQKAFVADIITGSIPKNWPIQKHYRNDLKWNPFPHDLAKVALEDPSVETDEIWEAFVATGDDVIDSSSLTWKSPGLKILRAADEDDDDDNEIELGQFSKGNPQNIVFLTKKRKLELDQQKRDRPSHPSSIAYKNGDIVAASALKVDGREKVLLEKMGWTEGMGLGTSSTGILDPVETMMRMGRTGLKTTGEEVIPEAIAPVISRKRKIGEDEPSITGKAKKILTSPINRPVGEFRRKGRIDFVKANSLNTSDPGEGDSGENIVPCDVRQSKANNLTSDDEDLGVLMSGFSAGAALDNFLEIRGMKRQKLTGSSYFATVASTAQSKAVLSDQSRERPIQFPLRTLPVAKASPLPVPSPRPSPTPVPIIISSSLLKQRSLVKRIEALHSGIKITERDFTAHNSTAWMPNSVTRSPITSSLASEADFIVSPTTGIIITSLQKINQKPLPGQKTRVPIRERLEKVSVRYEKLVVLVSEGQADENTYGLDGNSCQAFSEFMGFVLGLEASITVQFVGGGEEMLSKWLMNSIIQHGGIDRNDRNDLLDDETHWELFLRRAGMNAFAAQSVIALLKAPEGVNLQSPSKAGMYGLTAFVEMGREARITLFGALCGNRVLERVSDVVDAEWD